MRDAAGAEEARLARERAVDELVDQHEKAGIELLLEGAASGDGDDVGDAGPLERVDIGAIVDGRGRKPMALAVAGEEDAFGLAEPAEPQQVGRRSPRGLELLLAHDLQAFERIDAGPADHADQ